MLLNIKKIVSSSAFEKFITAVILINCFLIGVETYLVNELISSIQIICLVVFIIEIFLRYTASNSNREYFSEGWNIFDITIIFSLVVH